MFGINKLRKEIQEQTNYIKHVKNQNEALHNMTYEVLECIRNLENLKENDIGKIDDLMCRLGSMLNEYKGMVAMSRASLPKKEKDK